MVRMVVVWCGGRRRITTCRGCGAVAVNHRMVVRSMVTTGDDGGSSTSTEVAGVTGTTGVVDSWTTSDQCRGAGDWDGVGGWWEESVVLLVGGQRVHADAGGAGAGGGWILCHNH